MFHVETGKNTSTTGCVFLSFCRYFALLAFTAVLMQTEDPRQTNLSAMYVPIPLEISEPERCAGYIFVTARYYDQIRDSKSRGAKKQFIKCKASSVSDPVLYIINKCWSLQQRQMAPGINNEARQQALFYNAAWNSLVVFRE